jgi:type I restriction enzyme R subunit
MGVPNFLQILPELIELKYGTPHDTQKELGAMKSIRELFIGFQKFLYEGDAA